MPMIPAALSRALTQSKPRCARSSAPSHCEKGRSHLALSRHNALQSGCFHWCVVLISPPRRTFRVKQCLEQDEPHAARC